MQVSSSARGSERILTRVRRIERRSEDRDEEEECAEMNTALGDREEK